MTADRPIVRFLRLPATERHARFAALGLLWTVRVALWLVPFAVLRRTLGRIRARSRPARPGTADRAARSLRAAAPLVPACTCLTQALAAEAWLTRAGVPHRVRIGVARSERGVDAHAWVEQEGRVLLGGLRDLERFTPLPDLPRSQTQRLAPAVGAALEPFSAPPEGDAVPPHLAGAAERGLTPAGRVPDAVRDAGMPSRARSPAGKEDP